MENPPSEPISVVSPSGTRYSLAEADVSVEDQARHNYAVTGAYLRDVLETAVASGPPELAAMFVGRAISDMVRSLPVEWLREYAYSGIVRRAEQIGDDSAQAVLAPHDGQQ